MHKSRRFFGQHCQISKFQTRTLNQLLEDHPQLHSSHFFDYDSLQSTKWTARNSESVGELWLGFLRYYTEEFDYRRNVVCVRYLEPLTKFEKLWNGRQICIEGT